MRILLVEDEAHKKDEILSCVRKTLGLEPEVTDGVREAVLLVQQVDFDLVLLDMALSTFGEAASDNLKGHDQAQGGVEVLRALKLAKKQSKIIIITQFPDFYAGGVKVKLKNSKETVKQRYNQDVIGAILYQYGSPSTIAKIETLLRGLK